MHGDFSRTTFDATDGYRAVLLQQGRVLLDADWNEQTDITAHHDEVRTADVIGRSGGPAGEPGSAGSFAIRASDGTEPGGTQWTDLRVTPGTYYVDGILCESAPPEDPVGWPLTDQPHLPAIGEAPGLPEPDGAAAGDRYALYLDVWNHHVTADEQPSLLESALGGPDTTTRARTVWQVRAALLADGEECPDLHAPGRFGREPRPMVAGLRAASGESNPCEITHSGGYERLENQLYRVQVHDSAGEDTSGTFLWSRDNGSVVAGLLSITPGPAGSGTATLGLDRVGRDEELSFREHQLVEVTSTALELRGEQGFLARTGAPVGLTLPVTWVGAAPDSWEALGTAPVVRRWDGPGPQPISTATADLEAGITVRFPAAGDAQTGDYWTVPARTVRLAYGLTQLAGTIEWPPGGVGPQAQPPAGIVHHTAPLAILRRDDDGGWRLDSDCRSLFPALTELVTLDLVGGDGQEAMPGEVLPEPIRVVVRNGSRPVSGAKLSADAGTGFLAIGGDPGVDSPHKMPEPAATGELISTDDDGLAEIHWLLDPAGPATQTLTVRRLDDHRNPIDVPVVVTARLSVAGQVQWTPVCGGFDGARTVQDALAQLATTQTLRLLGGDGQEVEAPNSVLPQPVRVVLDSPCGPVAGVQVLAVAGTDSTGFGLVDAADPGQPTPATLQGQAQEQISVPTDGDGVAAFWWQPEFGGGRSATLDVFVDGSPAAPIRVTASLDPAGTRLPGVHITSLDFFDSRRFVNDSDVGVDDLIRGITIGLDAPVLQESVQRKPVVRVELDLPWPLNSEDRGAWADEPIGFRTVVLEAESNADGPLIVWNPSDRCRRWLFERLWSSLEEGGWGDPLLGRFILDGWAIIDENDPRQHLNGHAMAVSVRGQTVLQLPTDDAVTGGAFVQWFRLSRTVPDDERPVGVPNVMNRTEPVARRLLDEAGLFVSDLRSVPSPVVRRGLVAEAEPPVGTLVAPGTGVVLIISSGRTR